MDLVGGNSTLYTGNCFSIPLLIPNPDQPTLKVIKRKSVNKKSLKKTILLKMTF
jgi:hypothetical protein